MELRARPKDDAPLPSSLALLRRQLWFAVSPSVRFSLGPPLAASPRGTSVLERYWVLPNFSRARLLLPAGTSASTAGSASNYRRLRAPRERVARAAIGALARLHAPVAPSLLRLEVPSTAT